MRALLVASLLVASAASAQTASANIKLTVGGTTSGTTTLNASQVCGDPVVVTWNVDSTTAASACGNFTIWATASGACEGSPDGGEIKVISQGNIASQLTGTVDVDFTLWEGLGTDFCTSTPSVDQTFQICGGLQSTVPGICSELVNQTVPLVRVDSEIPGAPVLVATPLDARVSLAMSNAPAIADLGAVTIYYRIRPDGGTGGLDDAGVPLNFDGWQSESKEGTSPYSVTDLQNGQTYQFSAIVNDEADNPSPSAAVVSATPQKTSGFLSKYKAEGGEETGCSVAGGDLALVALVLMGLAWLLGRGKS